MILMSVVLPAPFSPIIPARSCASSTQLMFLLSLIHIYAATISSMLLALKLASKAAITAFSRALLLFMIFLTKTNPPAESGRVMDFLGYSASGPAVSCATPVDVYKRQLYGLSEPQSIAA